MSEVWKDIPGWDGQYSVSNLGNVRSNWRTKSNPVTQERTLDTTPLLLKLRKATDNRIVVSLGGRGGMLTVRRLVATAFVPNPKGAAYVRSIDGDWRNVAADNLTWSNKK